MLQLTTVTAVSETIVSANKGRQHAAGDVALWRIINLSSEIYPLYLLQQFFVHFRISPNVINFAKIHINLSKIFDCRIPNV